MRPENNAEFQRVFQYWGEVIDNAVTLGCELMMDNSIPQSTGPENIAIVIIFRHFIDTIDGIGILIKAGSGDAPKILLRVSLEALLYLEYIFKENTVERCLAYMVQEYISEIGRLEKLKFSTERGKKFKALLTKKGYDPGRPFLNDEIDEQINRRLELLNTSVYGPIYEQFKIEKSKRKGEIKWHQLNNGPYNIEQLATNLGDGLLYEVLYKKWSGGIHSADLILGRMQPDNDMPGILIVGIRHPEDIYVVTEHALQLSIKALKLYVANRLNSNASKYIDRLDFLLSKINELNTYNTQ